MNNKYLLGRTLSELQELTETLGQPKYRAKQIAEWLYVQKASTIDEMTNLPKSLRDQLAEEYEVGRNAPALRQVSSDKTEKYLFHPLTNPEQTFETVYIPEGERETLCVSSQVGCKMNCLFCATGKMGYLSNLTTADIINQVLSVPYSDSLTNIVFMGMGEPLDNYQAVANAIEIMTADYGFAWSPKRITVSTIGPREGLEKFLSEQRAHLAVSIHSPIPEERLTLMPVEKAFPITDIIRKLEEYDFSGQRRLSFEYIIFDELNDTMAHADALIRLLSPLDCRVNLIPYHAIPDVPLHTSRPMRIQKFEDYLNHHGLRCTTRISRGQDIDAACGMLSTKEK